jgi:hypothetical protein
MGRAFRGHEALSFDRSPAFASKPDGLSQASSKP